MRFEASCVSGGRGHQNNNNNATPAADPEIAELAFRHVHQGIKYAKAFPKPCMVLQLTIKEHPDLAAGRKRWRGVGRTGGNGLWAYASCIDPRGGGRAPGGLLPAPRAAGLRAS